MSGVFYPEVRSDVITSLPSSMPAIGDVMCQTITPLLAATTSPMQTKTIFKPAPVHERFADFPMSMSLRPSQMRAQVKETVMLPAVTASLTRRYGELDLPVTILTGAGDEIVRPDRHSERLHKDIDGSRLIKLPGIGHMANYSALPDVVTAIRETAASGR
jgi:pimeloyl-ACP methyl ester carboxylesterase